MTVNTRATTFDWLRLAGACIVVFGHSFALLRLPPFLGVGWHLYGLELFFLISGYLITGSWLTTTTALRYFERRARRILPALIIVVAATTFIVGPLLTIDPNYFRSSETYLYFLKNIALMPSLTLPGVFVGNPIAAVNGSLWTIPLEMALYCLTPLLVRAGPWACLGLALIVKIHPLTGIVGGFDLAMVSWIVKFYLIGAALRMFGARLPALRLPQLPFDLSYGIYLTAFPMQQAIIAFNPSIGPMTLTVEALAACAPVAWISWVSIEKPIIDRRRLPGVERATTLAARTATTVWRSCLHIASRRIRGADASGYRRRSALIR